jgi:hypothetical protein
VRPARGLPFEDVRLAAATDGGRGQPRKIADDMAVRKLQRNGSGVMKSGLPSDEFGVVSMRQNDTESRDGGGTKAVSFAARSGARRSLPMLSDKDLDRWRTILSRMPRDEKSAEDDDAGRKLVHSLSVESVPRASETTGAKLGGKEAERTVQDVKISQLNVQQLSAEKQIAVVPAIDEGDGSCFEKLCGAPMTHCSQQPSNLKSPDEKGAESAPKQRVSVDIEVRSSDCTNDTTGERAQADDKERIFVVPILKPEGASSNLRTAEQNSRNEQQPKSQVSARPETAEERTKRLQKLREEWFKSNERKPEEPQLAVGPSISSYWPSSSKPPSASVAITPASSGVSSTSLTVISMDPKPSVTSAVGDVATSSTSLTVMSMDTTSQRSLYVSPLTKSSTGVVLVNNQPQDSPAASSVPAKAESNVVASPKTSCFKMSLPSFNDLKDKQASTSLADLNPQIKPMTSLEAVTARSSAAEPKKPTISDEVASMRKLPDLPQNQNQAASGRTLNPSVVHEDTVTVQSSRGDQNIIERKTEKFSIAPRKYEVSKQLEKTVQHPTKTTFHSESEHVRNECEVSNERNSRITRHSVETKTERVYRMESKHSSVESSLTASNRPPLVLDRRDVTSGLRRPAVGFESEKFSEMSDGEMTDATDITLDAMVGANQGWRSASDAYEFSDAEFLSSANLSNRHVEFSDVKRKSTKSETKSELQSSRLTASAAAAATSASVSTKSESVKPDDQDQQAAIDRARAEMKIYRRDKKDRKVADESPDRRRSIKELVTSFEGMASPFLRSRPRSMEIQFDSSSSSDDDDPGSPQGAGRAKKKSQLKSSSSFKDVAQPNAGGQRKPTKKLTR